MQEEHMQKDSASYTRYRIMQMPGERRKKKGSSGQPEDPFLADIGIGTQLPFTTVHHSPMMPRMFLAV